MTGTTFSATELAQFERDGYMVARALVSAELCAAIKSLAQRDLAAVRQPVEFEADTGYPGAPTSQQEPGGRTVRRLLQAYARDPDIAHCASLPSIVNRQKQLIGSHIALSQGHHNCIMTKNPRYSSRTNWHQDIRYWSFQRPELVSVWVALGREYAANGCLLVLPGSHVMDFAAHRFDDATFLRPELEENKSLIATQRQVELEPGDVLFFHCRLLHAAGANQTADTKFALVFTYHSEDNKPLPGTRSAALPDVQML